MLGDLGDFRIILKTILGDLKNVKRFKNDDDIVRKLFPNLSRLFQRDQT